MKNITKKALTVMALLITLGTFAPQCANAQDNNDYNMELRSSRDEYVKVDSYSWATVASSTKGFNTDVYVSIDNDSVTRNDIRMLDRYGRVVWEQEGAMGMGQYNAKFWCGPDVYKVQIRTQSGRGVAFARWNK